MSIGLKTFFVFAMSLVLFGSSGVAVALGRLALGVNNMWQVRRDYGENEFYRYTPEVFAHTYFPLAGAWFLRPGARMSYAWQQPEMPQALRIEEQDFTSTVELGIVFDWFVVPSLSIGTGVDFRSTRLKTTSLIEVGSDKISRNEGLLLGTAQIGLGIPIEHGIFVLEPILRFLRLESDTRSWLSFGLESSFAF